MTKTCRAGFALIFKLRETMYKHFYIVRKHFSWSMWPFNSIFKKSYPREVICRKGLTFSSHCKSLDLPKCKPIGIIKGKDKNWSLTAKDYRNVIRDKKFFRSRFVACFWGLANSLLKYKKFFKALGQEVPLF